PRQPEAADSAPGAHEAAHRQLSGKPLVLRPARPDRRDRRGLQRMDRAGRADLLLVAPRPRRLVRLRLALCAPAVLVRRRDRLPSHLPCSVRDCRLMTQILMPALSPTMEEGNLAKW